MLRRALVRLAFMTQMTQARAMVRTIDLPEASEVKPVEVVGTNDYTEGWSSTTRETFISRTKKS